VEEAFKEKRKEEGVIGG